MPHASGISPAPWRSGLAARIFFAATLLVVVVLGLTFGLTSLQAHRTADESIRHALVGRRRGVQAFLAGRTTAFAGMSGVSAQVPQFRERLLQRSRGDVLDQAEEYRHLLGASWVLVTNERGLLVARTDYPAEFDIDLSRGALIARALAGEQADGAWLDDRAQRLYMAVAIPLRASPDASPQRQSWQSEKEPLWTMTNSRERHALTTCSPSANRWRRWNPTRSPPRCLRRWPA